MKRNKHLKKEHLDGSHKDGLKRDPSTYKKANLSGYLVNGYLHLVNNFNHLVQNVETTIESELNVNP